MGRDKISAIILVGASLCESDQSRILNPFRYGPIVSRLLASFRQVNVIDLILVLNEGATEFPFNNLKGLRIVFNDSRIPDVHHCLRSGINALDSDCEAFLLTSIETPLVRRTTIEELLATFESPNSGAIVPTFCGKRGFPVLVSIQLAQKVLDWNGIDDLADYLSREGFAATQIKVPDENILVNIGALNDGTLWAERLKNHDIPSVEECFALLNHKFMVCEELLAHSQAVANLAVKLASALNRCGNRLDVKLVEAAGLLHDMARGQRNHACLAANLLREMDFPRVAEIVEAHMDPMSSEARSVNEKDVVCFADKLVQNDQVVPLETRFQRQLDRHAHDPACKAAIEKRFANSKILKGRIEEALSGSISTIITELAV